MLALFAHPSLSAETTSSRSGIVATAVHTLFKKYAQGAESVTVKVLSFSAETARAFALPVLRTVS